MTFPSHCTFGCSTESLVCDKVVQYVMEVMLILTLSLVFVVKGIRLSPYLQNVMLLTFK